MPRLYRTVCLMIALAFPTAPVLAAGLADTLDRGPKVGEVIPHSLKVPDQNDQYQEFKSLARKRGLIVLFSRSLGW